MQLHCARACPWVKLANLHIHSPSETWPFPPSVASNTLCSSHTQTPPASNHNFLGLSVSITVTPPLSPFMPVIRAQSGRGTGAKRRRSLVKAKRKTGHLWLTDLLWLFRDCDVMEWAVRESARDAGYSFVGVNTDWQAQQNQLHLKT